jgi:hypothetical protein
MKTKLEEHVDGWWLTYREPYASYEILMKSKKSHGIKAHCMKDGKEIFTLRYLFIEPEKLLKKMKLKIDAIINGTWVPKKLKKWQEYN